MNIWIINHHAAAKGRHTQFARQLQKKGHAVTLFAASFKHYTYQETKDYPRGCFWVREETEDCRRIWLKTPPYRGNGPRRFMNQLAFARRTVRAGLSLERPQVIIGSSVHLFAALAAWYLSRRKRVPFVFEVRDLWPQTLIDLGILKEKSIITYGLRRLEKFLYTRAAKIISVLPRGADYITSLGIEADKIVYIPNGVDLEWFDRHAGDELTEGLEEFFSAHPGLIFTYTGAHGMANGLDTLIEASRILQHDGAESVHFLLVGDGPAKDSLVEKAAMLGLRHITFHPRVNKDQVPAILRRSHVCLSIVRRSRVHRYGVSMNKIFDYMASGKPMVSALESCFDFADVARCGLPLAPDNPTELAAAVLKMASLPERERQAMGERGRQYVEKHHDFRVLTKMLMHVIEPLASEAKTK